VYRGADKSLARPGWKQARKHVRDAAISTTSRRELSSSFFFPARQGAEGNSRNQPIREEKLIKCKTTNKYQLEHAQADIPIPRLKIK